jgi:predicted nucleotidyltransferase
LAIDTVYTGLYTAQVFIERLVRALEGHSVQYALVGGYAVALHGAVRGTVDVDLVIRRDLSAYQAAEQALKDLGLEPRLPVTAQDVFAFRDEYVANRNMRVWAFVNPRNPAEMVDILITEDLDELKVVTRDALGLRLRLVSIDDLIVLKRKSGRPQDIEDVKALEKLK